MPLSPEHARLCADGLAGWPIDGRRVLVLIPDGTRSGPFGDLFRAVYASLQPRAAMLDFMVALGTHAPMTEAEILARLEIDPAERGREFSGCRFLNHEWNRSDALVDVGCWTRAEVESLSDGRLSVEVPIEINRAVLDYDHVLIVGPVFPHEVAGYSGGNKYLFPGIAGPKIIDFFHWLGALVTNRATIGVKHTAVRRVLDAAAARLDIDRRALCMVVARDGGLHDLCFGEPEDAWSRAADVSAEVHVERHPLAYDRVLSEAPPMYPDLWTGGKCMYKLEPVVADGGALIIYAPHIRAVSAVHGKVLKEIGYHVRDYFVAQWERFEQFPWGVLAHSTHVKGDGTFDGVERPRIEVVLATGIPEEQCRSINLGYLDPDSVDPGAFDGLRVQRAGEVLHRLEA